MDVVDRRRLHHSVLEKVSPEDRELPTEMDIDKIIAILLVKPEGSLSQLIRLNIPVKVIVHTVIAVFQGEICLFAVGDQTKNSRFDLPGVF